MEEELAMKLRVLDEKPARSIGIFFLAIRMSLEHCVPNVGRDF